MLLKDHVPKLTLLQIALLAEAAVPIPADRKTPAGDQAAEAARTKLFGQVPGLRSAYATICAAHQEDQAGLLRRNQAVINGRREGMVADFLAAVSVLAKEESSDLAGLVSFFQNTRTLAHFVPPALTHAEILRRLELLKADLAHADEFGRTRLLSLSCELEEPLARVAQTDRYITADFILGYLDESLSALPAPEILFGPFTARQEPAA